MISNHFSIDEVNTHPGEPSLENECPQEKFKNAIRLAEDVLEPLRVLLGPLHINSWYRSPEVNQAVKGEAKSYHLDALAADIVPPGDVFNQFKMAVTQIIELPIDKIIFEHRHSDWIHVQVARDGEEPRRQAFTSHVGQNGNMVYEEYNA